VELATFSVFAAIEPGSLDGPKLWLLFVVVRVANVAGVASAIAFAFDCLVDDVVRMKFTACILLRFVCHWRLFAAALGNCGCCSCCAHRENLTNLNFVF